MIERLGCGVVGEKHFFAADQGRDALRDHIAAEIAIVENAREIQIFSAPPRRQPAIARVRSRGPVATDGVIGVAGALTIGRRIGLRTRHAGGIRLGKAAAGC
jgi:hypothetical protein